MLNEHCVLLFSNSRPVQNQSKLQNTLQGKALASALCFLVGQKIKSLHRLVLSGCLCVLVLVFLAAPALSADLTLAWDPNSEVDLEGYGVYFKLGASGPPYDLFGYVALQELNDPDNPAFAVTGLEKGSSYYFAVTAYDTAGNESGYSTPVCAQIGDQILPCTSASSGGSSGGSGVASGGSGGGGGGCFIETASDHQNKPLILMVTISFLAAISFIRFHFVFLG
ncbi:MAG TPA: fibronectin type III domain-containing protein [Desulfobacterales bacterium]|nr:fibronectin type III domain-containing protein [Desulfobacterales bacterium]